MGDIHGAIDAIHGYKNSPLTFVEYLSTNTMALTADNQAAFLR